MGGALEARLNVLLVALDQVAADPALVSELLLEAPCLSMRSGPRSDKPASRILEARWAEVALHHLRDQSDFWEKKRQNWVGGFSKAEPRRRQEEDK